MRILYYNWVDYLDEERRGGGVTVYQKNLMQAFAEHPEVETLFLAAGVSYDLKNRTPRWEKIRHGPEADRNRRYEIINSGALAPGHHSFGDPAQISHPATEAAVVDFVARNGPFDVVHAIAAIGLNILTGYCGQVSLGTGGFMAVGAYACYKLMTAMPEVSMFIHVILAGLITAGVGVLFGLPSLRIKGFYLAVATLAAQFFLVWLFNRFPWFYNYSASGQINAPERDTFGIIITGPNTEAWAAYLFCLIFTIACAVVARNLTRGSTGRKWMAIRDMDIAAEIIGVNPLRAKLSAFAVSSFFVGVSGALFFAIYLGAVEVGEVFGIQKSFLVLFMIIIGGLGSIFGSFAGAAFLVLLPVALKIVGVDWLGWPTDIVAHLQLVIVGLLIVMFLILEPHGLAQLWRVAKEKLRLWPFPH